MTSCAMIELHPSRYELFTDMVAASIPAATRPRNPVGRILVRNIGIAWSESCPGPITANAAIPLNIVIIPRPRKMKPVQVNTRRLTFESYVENVRIAVVCQQVSTANQNNTWKTMNDHQ